MPGLVLTPEGAIELREVPVPRIGHNPYAPRDVLVKVLYCGICGSDIHRWGGDTASISNPDRPVVGGHEIVSVVEQVGQAVTTLRPGDRVVHEIVTAYCGTCPACKEGRTNICSTIPSMQGRAHYTTGGGFAPYTVWPERQLHRLPELVSSRAAVLMEPTAGSVHSVVTRMGVRAGESVAILGPGARGLLLLQVCRAVGAGPILVSGLHRDAAYRLRRARELGADVAVDVEREELAAVVQELTHGVGVDVVLENTGAAEPIAQSLQIVRKGGRVLWAGGGIRGGVHAQIDTHPVIVKEIDIRGEISQIPRDWLTALELASRGLVEQESLVTHLYPLARWKEAFDLAASDPECLRVALQP